MVNRNFPKAVDLGPPHEVSQMKSFTISIHNELYNELREMALTKDRSLSNMACVLIKRGLKNKDVAE